MKLCTIIKIFNIYSQLEASFLNTNMKTITDPVKWMITITEYISHIKYAIERHLAFVHLFNVVQFDPVNRDPNMRCPLYK
jgi:hypothetical protein